MPERLHAGPAAESEAAPLAPAAPGRAAAGMAATLLGLQRTAGNAAAGRFAGQLHPPPRAAARGLQRREREQPEGAAALAGAVAARRGVQRTVKVKDPAANIPNPGGKGVVQTNGATVQGYLADICAAGAAKVDGGSGVVSLDAAFCVPAAMPKGIAGPPATPAVTSTTPVGCGCLCDMIGSAHTWTIVVDDVSWPHTDFDDLAAADGKTPGGSGGSVTTPSPNSPKLWGNATTSGSTVDLPSWLVLGHELCGHGWLGNQGIHGPDHVAPRGEGGHQETVGRENKLRAEHKMDLRGSWKDPNCGESYFRTKAGPGPVQWSSSRNVCIAWRNDYNKKNGTNYTINDRIP